MDDDFTRCSERLCFEARERGVECFAFLVPNAHVNPGPVAIHLLIPDREDADSIMRALLAAIEDLPLMVEKVKRATAAKEASGM